MAAADGREGGKKDRIEPPSLALAEWGNGKERRQRCILKSSNCLPGKRTSPVLP